MLRWYLIIVVVVGVFASVLGRLPSSRTPLPGVIMTNAAAERLPSTNDDGAEASLNPLDRGIVLTRASNGYFYADVQINNGAPLHMIVDTGATVIALSREDAQMAGLAVPIGMTDIVGQGADGAVRGQQVMLDRVTMGDKSVEGVPAIVLNSGGQSLLGQSFLSKFSSVHIEDDKMILR
jgi:aspartyl protease family protein